RPDSGTEERLVSINVSHSAQQLLIEQRTLDWRLATAEEGKEAVDFGVQRLVAGSNESRDTPGFNSHNRQPSEPSWINEAQLATRSQLQNSVSVLGHFDFGGCNQQPASHTEVYDPLPSFS